MDLASLRLPLYAALWLFSFLILCLTAARLHYTTNLPPGDTLNGGVDFYGTRFRPNVRLMELITLMADPIVVELLVCSLLAIATAPFVLRLVHRVISHPWVDLPREAVESVTLCVLSLLWIIGAGHSSAIWGDLSWCSQFQACRILSAMMAFAWLGWFCIFGLQILIAFDWFKARKASYATDTATAAYPAMRERSLPPSPLPSLAQV